MRDRVAALIDADVVECILIGESATVSHWRARTPKKSYFVKSGSSENACEAVGLKALGENGLRTPKVVAAEGDLLVTEWIETEIPMLPFWRRLGAELAQLHRRPQDGWGFEHDNYLGGTPQANAPLRSDWAEFFWERRLAPLIQRLSWDAPGLAERTRELLSGVAEAPSLVHGDLWNGNVLCGPHQTPYFIDPAPYRGHREVDLAMSEMFGGFDQRFYAAYDDVFPREVGYVRRRPLYNLYHLLNHWILFGASYRIACEAALVEITRTHRSGK